MTTHTKPYYVHGISISTRNLPCEGKRGSPWLGGQSYSAAGVGLGQCGCRRSGLTLISCISRIQHKVCCCTAPDCMVTAEQPHTNLPSGRYGEKCALSSMSCCLVCDIVLQHETTYATISSRQPLDLALGGSLSRRKLRCAEMLKLAIQRVEWRSKVYRLYYGITNNESRPSRPLWRT